MSIDDPAVTLFVRVVRGATPVDRDDDWLLPKQQLSWGGPGDPGEPGLFKLSSGKTIEVSAEALEAGERLSALLWKELGLGSQSTQHDVFTQILQTAAP